MKHWLAGLVGLFLLAALGGCSNLAYSAPTPTPQGLFPIYTELRNLYRNLGGETELGPGISRAIMRSDGSLCQYTTNAMLCYNANARSEPEREYLAPLAKEFNLQSASNGSTPPPIYEGFAEVYHKKFYGEHNVGLPLTPVLENKEKRRLEQYFERLGFYTLLDDPQKNVYLLAYGAKACREECAQMVRQPGIIGVTEGVEVLGAKWIDRLGGYPLWGNPMGAPYRGKDGSMQQILENAVVYIPADNPQVLRLRPLATDLKMPFAAPGPQQFGPKDNMVFRISHDEVGYHIPTVFNNFIISHGNFEISGEPITELYEIKINDQRVARQCFQNYCLDFHLNAGPNQQVQLVPLGQKYYQLMKPTESDGPFVFSRDSVDMKVSERMPEITSQQSQVIQLTLHTRKSNLPIVDVESFVIIALPGGKKLSSNLPITNNKGMAQVELPPLNIVGNGLIIPYVVCLNVPSTEPICTTESFLLWNHR